MRFFFVADEPDATIKIDENNSEPTDIKIISENPSLNKLQDLSIELKKKSYLNDGLDDMNRLRLALARTKIQGRFSHNLPIIRSATNVPELKLDSSVTNRRMFRNNLPIIRSSEDLSTDSLPVIRSASNVPRSKVIVTKPLNSLNFLASRMRLI